MSEKADNLALLTNEEVKLIKRFRHHQVSQLHEYIRGWYVPAEVFDRETGKAVKVNGQKREDCTITGCLHRGQVRWQYEEGYEIGQWLCGQHFFEVMRKWQKTQSE